MKTELDFSLYESTLQEKGFQFKNDDDTYFDLVGYAVTLDFYKDGPDQPPTQIAATVDEVTSIATVTFTVSHTDSLGTFEYVINGLKDGITTKLLDGNIVVKSYTPFSLSVNAFIGTELPDGMVLSENFINQKTLFWRLFLQSAFNISDQSINVDSAWPILVNALIAKLVVFDAINVAIKGGLLSVMDGSSTNSKGNVKSIETGPAKVEFLPAGEILADLLKSSTSANSLLGQLKTVLCGLASKLEVKLPMCELNVGPVPFHVYRDKSWEKITLKQVLEEPIVSIG